MVCAGLESAVAATLVPLGSLTLWLPFSSMVSVIPPILSTLLLMGRWKGLMMAWPAWVGEGVGVQNLLGGRRCEGGFGRSRVRLSRLNVLGITCYNACRQHTHLIKATSDLGDAATALPLTYAASMNHPLFT